MHFKLDVKITRKRKESTTGNRSLSTLPQRARSPTRQSIPAPSSVASRPAKGTNIRQSDLRPNVLGRRGSGFLRQYTSVPSLRAAACSVGTRRPFSRLPECPPASIPGHQAPQPAPPPPARSSSLAAITHQAPPPDPHLPGRPPRPTTPPTHRVPHRSPSLRQRAIDFAQTRFQDQSPRSGDQLPPYSILAPQGHFVVAHPPPLSARTLPACGCASDPAYVPGRKSSARPTLCPLCALGVPSDMAHK